MDTRNLLNVFRRRDDERDSDNAATPTGAANTREGQAAPEASKPAQLPAMAAPRVMPKPALRWVGSAGRIALRTFDFLADSNVIASWQSDTYSLNFPGFRYTENFDSAFRHDLRRASLDPNHGLFVLDGGALCGFLWLVVCENSWTGERYGYVNNIYVEPSQRGAGLGKALMEQAETWFLSRRVKNVRLTVTASNEAACRLYQSCGYNISRHEMEKEI
jgi:ribosomal protein S18 acetylase RimI-like enzyme